MKRRHFNLALAATSVSLAAQPFTAQAQSSQEARGPGGYPDKPIKLIVPYPAGGIVDVVMRAASEPVSNGMSNRILIDNKPGADGRIGMELAAKSAADGYTLFSSTPLLATGEHLMADMKGRFSEFTAVYGIAAPAAVYVVPSNFPARTLKEFVALATSKPGEFNVVNPGSGSSNHLAQELLFEMTGIKLTNVPYKGQPPALPDIAQGTMHFALISQSLALPLIKSGKLKPLAVNSSKRTRSLPDVPTIAEAGFPDALVLPWYGISVPAKTPPAIIQFLSDRFQKALALPENRAKLEAMDAEILDLPAARYQALIDSEFKRWGALIKKRNIQAN
jgi:tripartite-type tricarboxylate transporter receptor subunit TctC